MNKKVIFLGDLHLGARNGSNHFSDYFNKFFSQVLYPYCKKHNVKNIIQLGDCFDNRTNLSLKAFYRCKEQWFDALCDSGIHMHLLLGNHDITYRHTLEINSPELLLGEYSDCITIINAPTMVNIAGMNFDIVPWICDSNKDKITEFMARQDRSDILLGHFELPGFPMMRGQPPHGTGKPDSVFDGYKKVFSGHYHTRSEKGNIIYTGIPYEITWSDYADPKGFYVYDIEKNEYEVIDNPLHIFEKVSWNNGSKVDIKSLAGKIVKVIVGEKTDVVAYERWIDSIRLIQPYELSIIESNDYVVSGDLDASIEIADTTKIIDNYIDAIDTTVQKDDLKQYMQQLYAEAVTLDDSI